MSYCKDKTSAIVEYIFGDGKKHKKEFYEVPISVTKQPAINFFKKSASGGAVGKHGAGTFNFTINAPPKTPANATIWLIEGMWDDRGGIGSFRVPDEGGSYRYDGSPIQIGRGLSITGSFYSVVPVECYANATVEFRWDGCKLLVADKQGKILHEESGECPLVFKVYCNDDCPPGHIKCDHSGYPGYCCIPCKETADKINQIVSKIR